jgi:hypothetical protein
VHPNTALFDCDVFEGQRDKSCIRHFSQDSPPAFSIFHGQWFDIADPSLASEIVINMEGFKVVVAGGGLASALLANGLINNGVRFWL